MFIDTILYTIMKPFRELISAITRVQGVKGGIAMDARRLKDAPKQAKGEIFAAAGSFMPAGQQNQWNQPQAAPPPPSAKPGQKKKMSWWPWSKKTCLRCSQKLQKTWDKCPYCGLDQNQPLAAQQPGPQGAGVPPPQGAYTGGPTGPYGAAPTGPYGAANPYGAPMPTGGGPMKTIAMDAAAINAPLMATGDRIENVAWLVPLDGPLTGELLAIKTRSIIGSADGVEIKVMDASISGRHAEITLGSSNNRYRITDLGSRNGTYVNDKAIASVELVDGDNIRLGRTTFRFKTKN